MIYNLKKDKTDKRDYRFTERIVEKLPVPAVIDLSPDMPPIFDQLQLGSCTANSGTRAVMHILGNGIVLSRLFEYYKTRAIEHTTKTDSGGTNRDAVKSANKNGICLESIMPYDIAKFTKVPSKNAISDAAKRKIPSYYKVNNLDEVFQSLARGIPIVIGMDVYSSFESDVVAKTGIVPMPKSGEQLLGGHSILVEGKDDNKKRLKIANSWGKDWGDKGYFYLPYDYFNQYTFDYWAIL